MSRLPYVDSAGPQEGERPDRRRAFAHGALALLLVALLLGALGWGLSSLD